MLDRFKDPLYHLLDYLLKLIPTSFNQLINHRSSAKHKALYPIHPIQAYQLISCGVNFPVWENKGCESDHLA